MPIREANFPALRGSRLVFTGRFQSKSAFFFSFMGRSAARRAPLSGSKFDFFWPEMWPIMWGNTTSFKLEDWWTLEGARAALVETV